MSFFLKLFGLEEEKKVEKISFELDPDAFYLSDNYSVLEILPKENLTSLKNKPRTEENYSGLGYNMMTPSIDGNDVKIADRLIDINSFLSVINESQLKRVEKIGMIGVGLLENDERPHAFGDRDYALLFNEKDGVLTSLWLEGEIKHNNEPEIMELTDVLFTLGQVFDFMAVNWETSTYFDLSDKEEAEDFVRTGLVLNRVK